MLLFLKAEKRPTLILGNGNDTAQEGFYHTLVQPALELGWNGISYEGPGQPTVRRMQNIGFIPEWERAVTPVVDYLLIHKSKVVDPFGDYLAARAAAFEPRLKAVLVDGGVWDFYETFQALPNFEELLNNSTKEAFDSAIFTLLGPLLCLLQYGVRLSVDYGHLMRNPHMSTFSVLRSLTSRTLRNV